MESIVEFERRSITPPQTAEARMGFETVSNDWATRMIEDHDPRCVIIEYCVRCRWLLRAAWIAQELLMTFENEVTGVTLQPSSEPGVFRVSAAGKVLWCRSSGDRFPEPKEIKQLVRDAVCPGKDLGHADRSTS